MFGFFGSDKKQDSPAPQPQNTPQQPQRIIEKGIIRSRSDTVFERGSCIRESFGTTDLDLVLERYAPEQMDKIQTIFDNQRTIYNKLQEQDKKIDEQGDQLKQQHALIKEQSETIAALQEQLKMQAKWNEMLNGKLDFISGALGEMHEALLKKMGKEIEGKTPQK